MSVKQDIKQYLEQNVNLSLTCKANICILHYFRFSFLCVFSVIKKSACSDMHGSEDIFKKWSQAY